MRAEMKLTRDIAEVKLTYDRLCSSLNARIIRPKHITLKKLYPNIANARFTLFSKL